MKSILSLILFGLLLGCSQQAAPIRQLGEVDCMQEECVVANQAFQVSLILPDDIKPLSPFTARINVTGMDDVEAVRVTFEMTGMDMGQNQYALVREGTNVWMAESILPVCVTGRSDWQADVEIVSGGVIYKALFDFVISN